MSSEHDDFDEALLKGAFDLAARDGWPAVSVAGAAREAGVSLEQARLRFPGRASILLKLGQMADRHALSEAMATGDVRERLFDMLMRRFDVLQQYRPGVLALLRALPAYPGEALLLSAATSASMAWMLDAAGTPSQGLAGALRGQGLVLVWLYALRAWQKDQSPDLSGTMAALDRALQRAERAAGWFGGSRAPDEGPKPFPEPPATMTERPASDATPRGLPPSPAAAADQL